MRPQHLHLQNLWSRHCTANSTWVLTATGNVCPQYKHQQSCNSTFAEWTKNWKNWQNWTFTNKNYWDSFFSGLLRLRQSQRAAATHPLRSLRQQHLTARKCHSLVSLKTHSWKLSSVHFDYTTWWQSQVKSLTPLACTRINKRTLVQTQPRREQGKAETVTLQGWSVTCLRFTRAHGKMLTSIADVQAFKINHF